MAPASDERTWLALACTSEGTIVQILRDDAGIAGNVDTSTRFTDLVDSGSSDKAAKLLAAVQERGTAVGWELNVPSTGGARTLYFAGGRADDALLILGASGPDSLADLFDDVASANVATSQALGTLLNGGRTGVTASMSRDNRLYEELSRLNNELINRERELARKNATLARVSAEKSRIVAIAAHDLRNPLTVITSYADLLRLDSAVDEEHMLYLDEIVRSSRFMMELLEEMLDSSRLEAGHLDVDMQQIDLVAAGRHAAQINRLRADRKEIAIDFQGDSERLFIAADPVKLRQIVNNLVVNAIKFSAMQTTVVLRVRKSEELAVLEVEDQGIGIAAEKLATIFEPFKTIGSTGTAGEKSTGLGLSIVKQLVELMGATVHVESEVGRGSLFRVAFPLNRTASR
jgi:signal transduction histidine kinase